MSVNSIITVLCLSFFFLFYYTRNDLKTREACFLTRYNSDQNQNHTIPHPYRRSSIQLQAAVQSQPASTTFHLSHFTKPALKPPTTRPPSPTPDSREACGGDGRGRTSRIHAQGHCAQRIRALI